MINIQDEVEQQTQPNKQEIQQNFKEKLEKVNQLDINQAEQTFITARTKEESANAIEHSNYVYELIKAAQMILKSYKEETQEYKQEVQNLNPTTEPQQAEIVDMTKPKIEYFQKSLEKGSKTQNEINKIYQLQIAQLKKDDQELEQDIIKFIDRIQHLETVLGNYKKR